MQRDTPKSLWGRRPCVEAPGSPDSGTVNGLQCGVWGIVDSIVGCLRRESDKAIKKGAIKGRGPILAAVVGSCLVSSFGTNLATSPRFQSRWLKLGQQWRWRRQSWLGTQSISPADRIGRLQRGNVGVDWLIVWGSRQCCRHFVGGH